MLGQRIVPQQCHAGVDLVPEQQIRGLANSVNSAIADCVEPMPSQAQFNAEYCGAPAT